MQIASNLGVQDRCSYMKLGPTTLCGNRRSTQAATPSPPGGAAGSPRNRASRRFWIDIEVVEGEMVVSYYPPNEELLDKGKRMAPPPTMVYRRFHFVDHVPPEYAWTTSDPETMKFGGLGIQRMSLDT